MIPLFLQWAGGYGASDFLNSLENLGFFEFVLPFLLVFAVVFAILSQIPTFKDNKIASLVVSVAIGLMSLQLGFVPAFFQQIFPKLGVGLAILIVAIILGGAFVSETESSKIYKWGIFIVGILIFIAILISSLAGWGSPTHYFVREYGAAIITGLVIIAVVIGIAVSANND